MSDLLTFDSFVNRNSGQRFFEQSFYFESPGNMGQLGNTGILIHKAGTVSVLPSLPSGTGSYKLVRAEMYSTASTMIMIAKQTNMGSLDISTNTFTDGGVVATTTFCGNTYQPFGPLIAEVTTTLNATPGNLNATYKDPAGTSRTHPSTAMTASSQIGSCGFLYEVGAPSGCIDVTAASRTSGTTPTGVVGFSVLEYLAMLHSKTNNMPQVANMITNTFQHRAVTAGDKIGIFRVGHNTASQWTGKLVWMGDTT